MVGVPAASQGCLQTHLGQSSVGCGASSSIGIHMAASHPSVSAATRFREDMRRAMKESLEMGAADVFRRSIEEDAEQKAQYDIDTRCVNVRWREHGLIRVNTPAFGNCQFDAVVMTTALSISSDQLRQDVCDDMAFRCIYTADFIEYMRGYGMYGNEITLKAFTTL